ncbi:MAG: plastocyanin/azurin family copper-binding protein [Solirubrobacterales bacterium]
MRISRRSFLIGALVAGGGLAWAKPVPAAGAAIIRMMSATDGSDVWFDPIGLWVPPGTAVTWSNGPDQANTHTATAYHPANGRHQLRIPEGAPPWDSGPLLPGGSFSVTLERDGVYDYFCQPHESAGMVGRIVVGDPRRSAARPFDVEVPAAARQAFPAVDAILREKIVRR